MTSPASPLDPETMTVEEFQAYLPELFSAGHGNISQDPRYARFLANNPTCAELVRDLEYIAQAAKDLLNAPEVEAEPSDNVWSGIQSKLGLAASGDEQP